MESSVSRSSVALKLSASLLSLSFLAGCAGIAEKKYDRQLTEVAKRWSKTIRASQVIPTYPLTEDLMPGDVFLVSQTVDEQHEVYDEKGYLPFGKHIARLEGIDYPAYYEGSFGTKYDNNGTIEERSMPYAWLFPETGMVNNLDEYRTASAQAKPFVSAWDTAPQAAFPTYTVEVSLGGGAQMALPISGVPVALGLLGTASATASVNIKDAKNYGVSEEEIYPLINDWAAKPNNYLKLLAAAEEAKALRAERRNDNIRYYLRVVNRVFLTTAVEVSVSSADALAAGVDAGAAQNIKTVTGASDSTEALTALNENMAASSPADPTKTGGSVRFTSATQSTVGLTETFARPQVIGYWGIDYPIHDDGSLGNAVETISLLEEDRSTLSADATLSNAYLEQIDLTKMINGQPVEYQKEVYDLAAKNLGGSFKQNYTTKTAAGRTPAQAFAFAQAQTDLEVAQLSNALLKALKSL